MLAPASRSALVRMQANLCNHLRQVANKLNAEFARRRMGITVNAQAAIDAMKRNPTVCKRFADPDDRSGVLHDEQIATAVEAMFKVEVDSVQIANVGGKTKRFGKFNGRRRNWKKAYVCLKPGQEINFAAES